MLGDFLAAGIGWILFTIIRKEILREPLYTANHLNLNNRIILEESRLASYDSFMCLRSSHAHAYMPNMHTWSIVCYLFLR